MTSSKSLLILLFLGLASSKILRSYCANNADGFDKNIRSGMSGYFSQGTGELKKLIKAYKDDKKKSKDTAKFGTDWERQVDFVIKGKAGMDDAQAIAYCESLVGLYNFLMTQCVNVQDIKDQICMKYANKIDSLFGEAAPAKSKGSKGAKAQQTVVLNSGSTDNSSSFPKARRNKYANKKNLGTKNYKPVSPKTEISLPPVETVKVQVIQPEVQEIPQDLPIEEATQIAQERVKEEEAKVQLQIQNQDDDEDDEEIENFARTDKSSGVVNLVKRREQPVLAAAEITAQEAPENASLETTIEAKKTDLPVAAAVEVKPKKVKRIIVLEVVACKDCKSDENVKKFLTESN